MKPEDFRASTQRPFTGEEYLKACRMVARSISMASE